MKEENKNLSGPYYEFEDGRSVHVAIDGSSYHICFGNPNVDNPSRTAITEVVDGKLYTAICLSSEAFNVLIGLKQCLDIGMVFEKE